MKASEAYQEYCALKAHFERPSYDYFKYQGKVKASNYDERKDKNFFFRLSRAYNKQQLHEYYIANFLAGANWVGSMSKQHWIDWKKNIVRLPEVFAGDIEVLRAFLLEKGLATNQLFKSPDGQHPIIFRLLLGGYIQLETFIIFVELIGQSVSRFNDRLQDDPIWSAWYLKIIKYAPFLRIYAGSIDPYRNLVKEKLLNIT